MRRLPLAAGLLALLALGCWDDAERPVESRLQLTLSQDATTGGPGDTIAATGRVLNIGQMGVRHPVSCLYGVVFVGVKNPDGTWFDNGVPHPGCPDFCCGTLDPAEAAVGDFNFDGRIYNYDHVPPTLHFTPPGLYTIVATFGDLEAHGEFTWRPSSNTALYAPGAPADQW